MCARRLATAVAARRTRKPRGAHPRLAKSDAQHTLGEPTAYIGDTPLGRLHFPGPQVEFSQTPPAWPSPALVPRGSSQPVWV